jgi:hypothetical protein
MHMLRCGTVLLKYQVRLRNAVAQLLVTHRGWTRDIQRRYQPRHDSDQSPVLAMQHTLAISSMTVRHQPASATVSIPSH